MGNPLSQVLRRGNAQYPRIIPTVAPRSGSRVVAPRVRKCEPIDSCAFETPILSYDGCLRGHKIPEKARQAGWFQRYYLMGVRRGLLRLPRVGWLRAILLIAMPPLLTLAANR